MKTHSALALILFLVSMNSIAAPTCTGTPHLISSIQSNKDVTCVVAKLYEADSFCLVDATGNDLNGQAIAVSANQPGEFRMIFKSTADFNMHYALTCVAKDGKFAKSPKVIFSVGADGPADPNIAILNLYGSKGSWKPIAAGESYQVEIP